MSNELVIQPSDIFQLTSVPHTPGAERLMSVAFDLLAYLKPGNSLKTSAVSFHRISEDLIQISSHVSANQCVDDLVSKKIMRIPV